MMPLWFSLYFKIVHDDWTVDGVIFNPGEGVHGVGCVLGKLLIEFFWGRE